ncbi:MAG: FUSC family protein [Actinomycetota bacterium]|nr:FUSC family protein [Actinomycetota bacterium]
MHLLTWLRAHDPGFGALRRAGRTAIVMPALFAFGVKVLADPTLATFAAFGSFAMLLLVDFGGPIRQRVQAHLALAVTGAVLVCLGTLAARAAWLAAVSMAVVAFAVLFAGVVSSVLAGAATALLLAFILPVTQPGPVSSIPNRLEGWGLASGVALLAIVFLWPAPERNPLRAPAIEACRALADRIRSDLAIRIGGPDAPTLDQHAAAVEASDTAVAALRRGFIATPYRPTGLSTPARTLVRLVDELSWLHAIAVQAAPHRPGPPINLASIAVKRSVATLLDECADLLADPARDPAQLEAARSELRREIGHLEDAATVDLPVRPTTPAETGVEELITALEPSFRAQELGFAATQIAVNVALTVAAERRGWIDRTLGRQPGGLGGPLAAAQERAAASVDRHSVSLRNSIRGSVALGAAVLVANLSGVQHSFWVVLATLSVLRSSALNTGQNIARGLAGTVAGVVVGAGLVLLIGTNNTVLWLLLPVAILVAGVAPAAISFAAGQAAFTVTLVILFNIIAPAGWKVGLIRVEDIAIGCLVSLVVGLLFWPRGATAALRHALAEAYTDTAHYLVTAVDFGTGRRRSDGHDRTTPVLPTAAATRSAASSRRLDDTYRSYLAERGPKRTPLSDITSLVSGVIGVRLAADAVLDLWERDDGTDAGDRAAARDALAQESERVEHWYVQLADSFRGLADAPRPLASDRAVDRQLLAAVRRDLQAQDGCASSTAARMIWTGDHLDAVRRLQATLHADGLSRTGGATVASG